MATDACRATTCPGAGLLLFGALISVELGPVSYLLLASSERIATLNRKRVTGGGDGSPGPLRLKAKVGDLMCALAVLKTREDSR
jgi:hypothetical protein